MQEIQRIDEAAKALSDRIGTAPGIGVILGSGLGGFAESVADAVRIPYDELPRFPVSTVQGHEGAWISGRAGRTRVLCMSGRFHAYEGWRPSDIALPIRVMARMGVGVLIVTNAAGGIGADYVPGDLMLIADHINFAGVSPLTGPNIRELGPRFPDMSAAYDPALRALARDCAGREGIRLREGVYAMMPGPSFETPAEIRMLRALGADAVGMSTVPEVIAARHAGLRVLGISCITNCAAGILDQPLSHAEVMETGGRIQEKLRSLVTEILEGIGERAVKTD